MAIHTRVGLVARAQDDNQVPRFHRLRPNFQEYSSQVSSLTEIQLEFSTDFHGFASRKENSSAIQTIVRDVFFNLRKESRQEQGLATLEDRNPAEAGTRTFGTHLCHDWSIAVTS